MVRRRRCGCGQHRSPGQRQPAPRRRGLRSAPRKCDRVPVRVQSAWNGQGCAEYRRTHRPAFVQDARRGSDSPPITLGSRGSGQPANTPKSNTRVHQSAGSRPQRNPGKAGGTAILVAAAKCANIDSDIPRQAPSAITGNKMTPRACARDALLATWGLAGYARQTRGQVSGGGKKPYRQKGTGRADRARCASRSTRAAARVRGGCPGRRGDPAQPPSPAPRTAWASHRRQVCPYGEQPARPAA